MARAKVIASGSSGVVVLPKRFREKNGIRVGDEVNIEFPTTSMMTIEPVKLSGEEKLRIFEEMCRMADAETPVRPVPQTKEEVREMLAERYV